MENFKDLDERLKIAAQSYADGYTCSQAVISAFMEEMDLEQEAVMRLTEGFGGGLGGTQEICGALSAAAAVISYFSSNGKPGTQSNRWEVYRSIKQASELFRREYGGVTCREILRGDTPKAFRCGMKVKDAVLIANQIMEGRSCDRCIP